jgi:uncharacterized OB-fold protein
MSAYVNTTKRKRTFLRRPCKVCGKFFYPTGKNCFVCEDCVKRSYKNRK